MSKPQLLILSPAHIPSRYQARLENLFEVIRAPEPADQERLRSSGALAEVRAAFVLGSKGLSAVMMDAMPRLEIVCCKGAGHDGFDVAGMRRRGLALSHGPGCNAPSVAEHAVGLTLATVRTIPQRHMGVLGGEWLSLRAPAPLLRGKRLGILGLGTIGALVAETAMALKMTVAYHNRRPRTDVDYDYRATPATLAADADVLLLTCPGGPETRHIVDRTVLDALGPTGYLVNVARGTCVDSAALADALHEGWIAGAALDVVEGEPEPPKDLLAAPNLVITPHVGGESLETSDAQNELLLANLQAHFEGRPLPTPIP